MTKARHAFDEALELKPDHRPTIESMAILFGSEESEVLSDDVLSKSVAFTSRITSLIILSVSFSIPFAILMIIAEGSICFFALAITALICCDGTASTITLALFTAESISGKKEIRLGNINTRRDFSYIDDTISGFIACLKNKNIEGQIINLGTGFDFSI